MSDAYAFIKRCRVKNASAKLVLFAIGEYMDERGVSAPSSAVLRADTYFCPRTISSCLDILETDGFIVRKRRSAKGGKRLSDQITVLGFAAWVEGLKAAMPKHAIEDQVQILHMQNVHVREVNMHDLHLGSAATAGSVSVQPPTTTSSDAKSAPRRRSEMALNSNTLPLDNLSSLCAKRAVDPRFAGFDAVWAIWRGKDTIRRSRRKPSHDAYCDAVKSGADPARIMAGASGYLSHRDKSKEGGKYLLAFAKFIAEEEFEEWADTTVDGADEAERRRRVKNFEFDGTWLPSWGPRPERAERVA